MSKKLSRRDGVQKMKMNEEKKSRTTSITWALKASPAIQLQLQSTIPMVCLFFSRHSPRNTQEAVAIDVEALKQANVDEITSLYFEEYCFDEDSIVSAVVDLLRRAFQKGLQLKCLSIADCTGRVDEILHMASSFDMFDMISLVRCDSDGLSQHGFWSISSAMKYSKHLTKLVLSDMEMTKQQATALGAGLITSNSQNHQFKELRMESVKFAHGAITELASGLKQNSSLCILSVDASKLGDAELVKVIDAVDSHPALKELSLRSNQGQRHALVALGKVLASKSCRLRDLDLSAQSYDDGGLEGWLGSLVHDLQWSESLTRLNLGENDLLDTDMNDLGQILARCKLESLNLRENKITLSGFVSLTQNIPKSLKRFDFSWNNFNQEEAACHTLKLFEEHPQLWKDGFWWADSKSPIHQKIQHFKDLNRCGRILLVRGGAIPLSVWPIVLARANRVLQYSSDYKERTANAIFHLLQGPALMQRRFDRDSSQATCVGAGASERLTRSSKRGPAETIDKEGAKKGRSSHK
jgi:hypothetical protein